MTEIIDRIETFPFKLPMFGELKWGSHSGFSEARHVLVKVILKSGATGYAEALPRPTIYGETLTSIEAIINSELAPRLIGRPVDFDQFSPLLDQIKNNQTARGALDMALHDAIAQAAGITLAEHLGCTQEKIRVSYILGVGKNDTMIAEAERVYELGVRVLKVKIGRDWAADVERLSLLRQIAPDLDLYVDANETMTAENAAGRLESLREMGILYCEEPLPVELVRERAALREAGHLFLIGDDSCFSLPDLKRELALDTFDILNIKCARTGFTTSKKMAALARQNGKGIMIGSQASATLGAARHAVFAARPEVNHPSETTFFLKLKSDIVNRPVPIRDGYIHIADLAEVEVDEGRLKAHQI